MLSEWTTHGDFGPQIRTEESFTGINHKNKNLHNEGLIGN